MSLYIGLMSGTSSDGIDATVIQFEPETRLVETHSIAYSKSEQNWLRENASQSQISWTKLAELDNWIAQKSAHLISELLEKANLKAHEITAIGSHGHTFYHKPAPNGCSFQLGNGHLIAELTGIDCINDFRRRDIAAEGQGAPLVCAFHKQILKPEQRPACIVNIGGISNLTYIDENTSAMGFDTGPGNCLLDDVCQQRLDQSYDPEGQIARSGQAKTKLLKIWLKEAYFNEPAPKSTGREHFNLKNLGDLSDISTADLLASLVDFTAKTMSDAINQYAANANTVYVCGGGVKNSFLLERLAFFSNKPVTTTLELGIHPQWMESMAFGWLAYCFVENKTSNCREVTGAKTERILGALHKA